jgi:outer membrane protein
MSCKSLSLLGILFFAIQASYGQSEFLSIKDVLQKTQANLPQLEVYRQQAAAAQQNIALVKNGAMPDLTAGYQVNMATFNNITGMSYPGFLLPISGPPSLNNDWNYVPGSALGALIKWNPFTFGQRTAAIEKANAQFKEAGAVYNEQLFRYQYSAVNIYLELIYLRQVIKTQQAAIERNKTGLEQSLVLAKTGLKPGIDTAQFQSTIVQSEIDVLQTERTYNDKLVELSRLTGINGSSKNIVLTDSVFNKPVTVLSDTFTVSQHPYYQTIEAQKKTTEAGLKEIEKAWVPQLDFWGNLYARGSGVDAKGNINKWDGLNLSRTNSGIGVQLSFPVLQYSKVNIQKKQYQSLLKASDAKLEQAKLDISKQTETALLQYQQDVNIASKMPLLVKVAGDVYEGLKLSYQSGLIDYTRLSQAQYDMLKAEINQANASLQVGRSLLAIAIAKGNLSVFSDQLK